MRVARHPRYQRGSSLKVGCRRRHDAAVPRPCACPSLLSVLSTLSSAWCPRFDAFPELLAVCSVVNDNPGLCGPLVSVGVQGTATSAALATPAWTAPVPAAFTCGRTSCLRAWRSANSWPLMAQGLCREGA